MNVKYIWANFVMGLAWRAVMAFTEALSKQLGKSVYPARRLQFYGDREVVVAQGVEDLSVGEEIKRIFRRLGLPTKLRNYNALVPIRGPSWFMKSGYPVIINYLSGRLNIGVSDAVFDLGSGEVIGFDRVTLDLDVKNEGITLDEAREVGAKVLERFRAVLGVDPIIVYSGHKGIHIVYFLNKPLPIVYLPFVRMGLAELAGLGELGLKLDNQTVRDVRHVFRLPLTINLNSGNKAEVIHLTRFERHVLSADIAEGIAKLSDPLLGRQLIPPAPQMWRPSEQGSNEKVVEWASFIDWLREEGVVLVDCRKRFAYLLGIYCRQAGFSIDDCESLLNLLVRGVDNRHIYYLRYGYEHPQYLPHVRKFIRGGEWYSCSEVEELRRFRLHRAKAKSEEVLKPPEVEPQGKPEVRVESEPEKIKPGVKVSEVPGEKPIESAEALLANPKLKEKPEVKPGEKAETKVAEAKPVVEEERETVPSTGRPVQTRLARFIEEPRQASAPKDEHLVIINIPTALIKDVARELRAPTTVAEPLVNWVVNYLNRPCCWSVGFDRLAEDLAKARDEEVQFALETLGIEVREMKVTDEGFARLRSIAGTIIKYLEKAGFVEYLRDLGAVNLARGDSYD